MKIGILRKTTLLILFLISILLAVKAQKTGVFESTITFGNRVHTLAYSVPTTYNPETKYPIIIGLHGCPEPAVELRNALKDFSSQYGAIVACPDNFGGQISDINFILRTIDSTRAIYSVDTTMVFLTGFSCGGQSTVDLGLNHKYKFRGIFPWDPYSASVNYKTFDKEMPIVLAFGNNDGSYANDLVIYDSLKSYNAPINIVIAQGVAHQIPSNFKDIMFKSYRYLLDSNMISMSPVDAILVDSKSPEVKVTVKNIRNSRDRALEVTAYSAFPSIVGNPTVAYVAGSDSAVLTFKPGANIIRASTTKIIVEAKEIDGTAIEQVVFDVNVKVKPKYPVSASSQFSFITGPENAVDALPATKWMSKRDDNQWLCVDLCRTIPVNGVRINWSQQATEYAIKASVDSVEWKEVYSNSSGKGGKENISFETIESRYIQLDCIKRSSITFSIFEFQVDSGQFAGIKNTLLNKDKGMLSLFPSVLSGSDSHTTISYSLQKPTTVNLSVFTIEGQKINTLVNSFQQPGDYSIDFDIAAYQKNQFVSGMFLFVISTPEFSDQKKMMIIR